MAFATTIPFCGLAVLLALLSSAMLADAQWTYRRPPPPRRPPSPPKSSPPPRTPPPVPRTRPPPPKASPTPTPSSPSPSQHYDAIVVGAGISGLAAAKVLQASGLKVLVLEGRERLGGRMWTEQAGGVAVDLGAQWIHGREGNQVHADIIRPQGMRCVDTPYDDTVFTQAAGGGWGEMSSAQYSAMEGLYGELESHIAARQNAANDASLRATIDAFVTSRPALTAQQRQWLNFSATSSIEHEYSGDVGQLSTWWYDSDSDTGSTDCIMPGGFSQLIDFLARNLTILTGRNVAAISQSTTTRTATVTTAAGAAFTASYVVVTAPLGVLKRGKIAFSPALSAAKQTAISRVGFGTLDKVALVFPSPFWGAGATHMINRVPPAGQERQWIEFFQLHTHAGLPVLAAFNAGGQAVAVEALDDATILAQVKSKLKELYPGDYVEPSHSFINRWAQDPFAYGSYSFNALGSTPGTDRAALAKTEGLLYFAGEHTHKNLWGTLHGAYVSGKDAAAKLLTCRSGGACA